jgi:transcriptional regulator with XRE-family HTH domain
VSSESDQAKPFAEMGVRLKAERERLHLRQQDFANAVGVSKTTQFNYESGERAPDGDYLRKATALGVDALFVIAGVKPHTDEDFVVISRFDIAASAGGGALNEHEISLLPGLSFSRVWLSKRGLSPATLRVVDVAGDSMASRLNDGDQVLMNVGDTTPKSGRAYVLRQGDELLVKYCQLLPGGVLRVSSENQAYPSYDVDLNRTDEVTIIGRVVASMHEW